MAPPPRGDPRRPLHLAVRSARLLGGFFIALGMCGMYPLMRGLSPGNLSGRLVIAGMLFYFVPGLLYLVFSIYLARRQFRAVVGALVLSSLQLVVVLIGLAGMCVVLINPHSGGAALIVFPMCITALVAAAIGQLVYHLARSFEAIKYPPYGEEFHGFEPVMARPVTPPPHPPVE